MRWNVSIPRVVAEDDHSSCNVEADTIEEAIQAASRELLRHEPQVGQVFNVSARVEVAKRPTLPLKSV